MGESPRIIDGPRRMSWWERREPDGWRLEFSCRCWRWRSKLCDRVSHGKDFWGPLEVDEDGSVLQRCRFCRSVRFEPATIDIRGTRMTQEDARRIGRSWLEQMDADGRPMHRVRVYYRADTADAVESFNVWAIEDEMPEAERRAEKIDR